MISAATLQRWVPGGNANDLADLEAGIVAMIERESGRDFRSPRAAAEPWILDVPRAPSGGLTRYNRGEVQWLALPEQPQRQLTGTWTITAGTAALAGSSGAALSELTTDSAVEIGAETIKVSAITDNDTVTLAANHTAGASAATIHSDFLRVSIRSAPAGAWSALDPVDDVELDRETKLRIFSKAWNFPQGRRRVKIEPLLGYAADSGPADLMMLMRDMVTSWYERGPAGIKSESGGGITLTYADFGSSGQEFLGRSRALGWPLLRAA